MAKSNVAVIPTAGEIITRPSSTSIAISRPAEVETFDDEIVEGEDTGLDDVSQKERRVPILRPLDPKSPQCHDPSDGGIPGARPGSIYNSGTETVYDGKLGIYMIPVHRYCAYVDYIKRNDDGSGGGFVGIYEPEDPIVKQRQAERMAEVGNLFGKLANGHTEDGKPKELVETWYIPSVMILPNPDGSFPGEFGEVFPALVPFSSTNIKVYNGFIERNSTFRYPIMKNGVLRQGKPTLWSHVWRLRTRLAKRGNQSWYMWQLGLAGTDPQTGAELPKEHSRILRSSVLYKEAESLRELILEGRAVIDYTKQAAEMPEGASSDNSAIHDQIPFGNS